MVTRTRNRNQKSDTTVDFGVPKRLTSLAVLAVIGYVPQNVWSETTRESGRLEEIVVTASKRGFEESLQDVPMSIQALSERTLEQAGAKDFLDFARLSPSVDILPTGISAPQVAIRGVRVTSVPAQTTQEKPLTSIYIDDLPVSFANFNPNLDLFDVQRVEVLRGPQGTLYGAGAMGGNIRFVTNQPDSTSFGGKVEASLGTIDEGGEVYDLKGLVNIPIVQDKMALRITGTLHENEGFVDNPFLGQDDWNELSRNGIRASFLYDVNEDLAIAANYIRQEQDMKSGRSLITDTDFDDPTGVYYSELPFTDEMSIYNLTVNYDLDWAQLHSSSSYYERDFVSAATVQGIMEAFFGIQVEYPSITDWSVETFVQEIRLSSTQDSKLTWVLGAYYSVEDLGYVQNFSVPGFGEQFGFPTDIYGAPEDVLFFGDVHNDQEQYAIFGEATYRFNESWELTVGLRWFDWKQEFDLVYAGFFQGGLFTIDGEDTSASEYTPKFNLAYHVSEDWMVYGNIAQGYRLGGANDPVPPDLCAADLNPIGLTEAPTSFEPDSLWSFELGSKASLAQGRVQLNAAIFQIQWEDVQTLKVLPSCGFYFTENVGEVETSGLEVELTAMLLDGLTLSIGGAWTDGELTEDVPNVFGSKGDSVPYTPELAMSLAIDYTRPLSESLDGYARLDIQYVDERNTQFNQATGFDMDAYEIGNLHIGVQSESWEALLFVKNIWDEDAVLNVFQQNALIQRAIEQPRTYGMTVRMRF